MQIQPKFLSKLQWVAVLSTISILIFTLIALVFSLTSLLDNIVFITRSEHTRFSETSPPKRLVCYYTLTDPGNNSSALNLSQVDANLCTHINIGITKVENCSIILSDQLRDVLLNEVPALRKQNKDLRVLLWVGGGDASGGFPEMVVNHANRKIFIKSIKELLHTYELDGVDLDWEFPSAYEKERQHFSQLLYEIRQEYKREKRNYLLSIAVAAVEGIALFAYDIREINLYADYVNLMTYDYHFYTTSTPFTGLNAPLYARDSEHSILGTLNINYSVNWWLSNGLKRNKLVVGLPTYGHSFTLVNPFNNRINAPASDVGSCGNLGYTTYSDLCWFLSHNVGIKKTFDEKAASPYVSSGSEWISYENEMSITIKTNYIRSLNLGGVMVYALNTDDVKGYCAAQQHKNKIAAFPLIRTIKSIIFNDV